MKTFPDYTVIRELGKGATATVYLAVQKNLNRRVALKVLGRGLASDATFTQRFLREGRIIAKLSHPNIVPVYDVGSHDGTLFMAMEYLDGGTLEDRRAELTLRHLSKCFVQISDALGYAHRQGFVHRDIKLDNILYRRDGEAVLGDFGIARAAESLTRMTVTGAILGTPAYMSPEQVAGSELDGRADLYSLGVVLFELLTGHAPFQGDSVMSVGLQHLTAPVPELPEAAAHFEPLIGQALAKKPTDRFESAADFRDALTELIVSYGRPSETPLSALHGDTVPQAMDIDDALSAVTHERSRQFPVVGALAAVLAIALTVFFVTQRTDPQTESPMSAVVPELLDPAIQRNQEEVSALLQQANDADQEGLWFSDNGTGAIDLFRDVLEIDAQNTLATAGLQRVRRSALQRVELELASDRLEEAESELSRIDANWPNDESVANLASNIELRRSSIAANTARENRNRRLTDHLERASSAARRGEWMVPEETSALSMYRAALSIDPENAIALAGVDSVATHFINQAEQAIAGEEFERATELLGTAATIDANHARLALATQRLVRDEEAFAERRRKDEELQGFEAQVADLSLRVNDYIAGGTGDDGLGYESLSSRLAELASRNPDNVTVQALRNSLDGYEASLNDPEDTTDSERFIVPIF